MSLFKNKADFSLAILSLLLITYLFLRAWLLPVTHDEAYSFHNMKDFWYPEALCTGNTHWLNSLAIKVAIMLKVESAFAIRWLSLCSATGIVIVAFLWIRSESTLRLKTLIFSVLLLNPYVLDYLIIARGYASGLLFETLSLTVFMTSLSGQYRSLPFLSLLFAGLSALAQFSFVYFFAGFSVLYFSMHFTEHGLDYFKKWRFYAETFFVLGTFAMIFRAFLFISKCSNDVVGAGTQSIDESFAVFGSGLCYGNYAFSIETMYWLSLAISTIIVFSALYGILPGTKKINIRYFYSAWLLLFILFIPFALHFLFDFVLPYYRSALFLYPLSAVCFVFFIYDFFKPKVFRNSLSVLVSVLLLLNFGKSIQLKSVMDYRLQADLKKSFDNLKAIKAGKVGCSPELFGGYRNYYQMTEKFRYDFIATEINTREPRGVGEDKNFLKQYDYLMLSPPYDLSYYRNNHLKFTGVKYYKESGTLILRVNQAN